MARLILTIDVPVDPTRTDPHDVGFDVLTEFNLAATVNGRPSIEFIEAFWEDHR